jgi:uncharacterized protein YkwD
MSQLERASQKHSERVIAEGDNCMPPVVPNPHQCPGEPGFSERAKIEGYNMGSGSENIAQGQTTCQSAVESWMSSEGHRAAIMNTDYKDIGCGMKNNLWTCMFGLVG